MPTAALSGQFLRFCLVGGIGFVVDAGSLWLLIDYGGMGLLSGRVVSYLIAATVTWALHRHFTFPHGRNSPKGRQWVRFVVVNAVGAGINYGVYALLVLNIAAFAQWPVLAVAAGSVVALAFNFLASRHFVFRV
ncbi:MAG: GtrA family protein [Pseudomonadota bacterium]